MFRWPAKIALVAAAAIGVTAWAQFRADVRLVHIIATVKDRSGQLVGGLQQSDFSAWDNGVPQEIKLFERQSNQPLSIALISFIVVAVRLMGGGVSAN